MVHEGDELSGTEAAPEETGSAEPRDRTGMMADPLVRVLTYLGLGIFVTWLLVVFVGLLIGLPDPKTPRTAAERALLVYEAQIEAGTSDVRVWAGYIRSLIDAEQYNKARQVLDLALSTPSEDRSLIIVERARLSLARGDFEECVTFADEAIAEARLEIEAERQRLAERQLGVVVEPETPASMPAALLIKASAYEAAGDNAAAVAVYDEYLKTWTTAADVLVSRGDLKAELGDTAGAEADYREALRFGSDYRPALDGLDRIGADSR